MHNNSKYFSREILMFRIIKILGKGVDINTSLQQVCDTFSKNTITRHSVFTRISLNGGSFQSYLFEETNTMVKSTFSLPDGQKGLVELFLSDQQDSGFSEEWTKEAEMILEIIVPLLIGLISKIQLEQVTIDIGERRKELSGINRTTEILQTGHSLEESLPKICSILPYSWQFPDHTVARICFDKSVFESPGFRETPWKLAQGFEAPGHKKGMIEIYYLKEFPTADEGPFLKEERNLLINLSNLIAGSATREVFNKLQHENTERLKELKAINQTTLIIEEGKMADETLQEICSILPKSWQYPRYTTARIRFEGKSYTSENFTESDWVQSENFVTIDNKKGSIEIFYLKQFPKEDEGPFLHEERNLLINISLMISGYLNNFKGREIIHRKGVPVQVIHPSDDFRNSLAKSKKPLQLYFNQQSIDKYVYLDMMRFKIKHILFVATLYDAFTLESEDSFFEKFMGESYQYSLFSVPRITGVSSAEEALNLLIQPILTWLS